jgi:pheromone a factor receptor
MYFPPLLFSVIALIYAGMLSCLYVLLSSPISFPVFSLHHFIRRRLAFAAHLQNSNSALTTNRYLRLIAMAVTEMIWGTVFTAYNLYNNVAPGVRPWTNWADVHSNFSRVDLYPSSTISPDFLSTMMFLWWAMPASSIIFFLFFGFGEDAMQEYRKVWAWFKRTILKQQDKKSSIFTASIPPRYVVRLEGVVSSS